MSEHNYYVYIVTNKSNYVLYTGVSNDLHRRTYEHKKKAKSGFTKKYNCTKLVYFEHTSDIELAITREKQIKAGSRQKKINLIESVNPNWDDLTDAWE